MNKQEKKMFIEDMKCLMEEYSGIGLASPQVSREDLNIVLIRNRAYENPWILYKSKRGDVQAEVCLSFPGVERAVHRSVWILMIYRWGVKLMRGLDARIAQHEIDHLWGKTILDYKK